MRLLHRVLAWFENSGFEKLKDSPIGWQKPEHWLAYERDLVRIRLQ